MTRWPDEPLSGRLYLTADAPHLEPGEPVQIFGREPAQLLGLLRAALVLVSATVVPLTIDQQGAVIAVLAAVFGVLGAIAVSADKAAPLIAGLVEAVLACALAFGANLDPGLQGAVMAFVAAGIAFYLRTQVVAPVDANGQNRPVAA